VGRVALVARVTAFLEKRLFVEGSEVKRGDLLYLLEQPPFQAQVDANKATIEQLEAQHRNAEQALERAQALLKTQAGTQSTADSALAAERALAAQIAGAQAQLQISEINLGYTEIRAPIDGKISSTAVTECNVVSPSSGTLATLVSQDPMYVIFSVAQRTGLDLRNRYAAKGGFGAVVIKLRLPDGQLYEQDGKVEYASPTVAENTDHDHRARGDPQHGVSGRGSRNARFAAIDGRGIRDRGARRRGADLCSRHPARGGAVRSARRIRVCRRRAEQGGDSAHPARPIDPVHRRGNQRLERRGIGRQRRATAGPPRPSRIARSGEPRADNSTVVSRGA
jgi:hypothetical protein